MLTNEFNDESTTPDGIARLPMVEMASTESVQRELNGAVWMSEVEILWVIVAPDAEEV